MSTGPAIRREHESLLSEARLARGLTYQKLSELTGVSQQRLSTLSTGTAAPRSEERRVGKECRL